MPEALGILRGDREAGCIKLDCSVTDEVTDAVADTLREDVEL